MVSQSGRSPDLVNATEVARKFGALTLAIVNDENSPAAAASELVLPIGAGTERSVAATKTVVLSMIAGAQLVAALARDDDLNEWPPASAAPIVRARSPATGRLGRTVRRERSGGFCRRTRIWPRVRPRDRAQGGRSLARSRLSATARPNFGMGRAHRSRRQRPCWCCDRMTKPQRRSTSLSATSTMRAREYLSPEVAAGTLPWIGDGHPVCDPVLMLIPAYRAIEAVARRRGFDPDNPPYLSKVTRTL